MHTNGYLSICGHIESYMLLGVLENNLVNDRSRTMALCMSSQLGEGKPGYRNYK